MGWGAAEEEMVRRLSSDVAENPPRFYIDSGEVVFPLDVPIPAGGPLPGAGAAAGALNTWCIPQRDASVRRSMARPAKR